MKHALQVVGTLAMMAVHDLRSSPVVFLLACAKSKCASPNSDAILSGLQKAETDALVSQWLKQTADLSATYPVTSLYRGASWAAYRKVMAEVKNFSAYALSAGFGLVALSENLPAYSASFAAGEDRIASHIIARTDQRTVAEKHRSWWSILHKQRGTPSCSDLPGKHSDAIFVVVGGKDYMEAVHDDLTLLAKRCGPDRLFLISAGHDVSLDSSLAPCAVPVSTAMEYLLPGARLSLNARILLWLITEIVPQAGWRHAQIGKAIGDALQTGPKPPLRTIRKQMTDAQILFYIHQRFASEAHQKSATRALRSLREEGFACEEGRFRRLYEQENQHTSLRFVPDRNV